MLNIVVFLLLITGCTADWPYVCTMPQWEGVEASLTGTLREGAPALVQSVTRISYDINNTRLATEADVTENGATVNVKNIYDYKQKSLYTIRGDTCRKSVLNKPFRQMCVPKNFYMTWTKTFYGFLYEPVPNDLFIFEFRGNVSSTHHTLQTTYTGDPVLETLYGEENGVPVFSNSAFLNITAGIKDPEVFVPPPSCNKVNFEPLGNSPEWIGVFSFSPMDLVKTSE